MFTGLAAEDLEHMAACHECGIRVKINDYEEYMSLHDEKCTFESFLERFGAAITVLKRL